MNGKTSSKTSGCIAFRIIKTTRGFMGSLGSALLHEGVAGREDNCCRSTLSMSLESKGVRSSMTDWGICEREVSARGDGKANQRVSEHR